MPLKISHLFAMSKFIRKSWYYITKQNSPQWRTNTPSIFLHRKKKTWNMKIHCLPSTSAISHTSSLNVFSGCSSAAFSIASIIPTRSAAGLTVSLQLLLLCARIYSNIFQQTVPTLQAHPEFLWYHTNWNAAIRPVRVRFLRIFGIVAFNGSQ